MRAREAGDRYSASALSCGVLMLMKACGSSKVTATVYRSAHHCVALAQPASILSRSGRASVQCIRAQSGCLAPPPGATAASACACDSAAARRGTRTGGCLGVLFGSFLCFGLRVAFFVLAFS